MDELERKQWELRKQREDNEAKFARTLIIMIVGFFSLLLSLITIEKIFGG